MPVEQGRGDRLEHVGRGDEHHLREVEIDVEVMVAEGRVLLGVEDFQQRGRGVAAEVGAELVDLVEHEDRVVGPRLADSLDDPAGHGGDVGAAVAADLGLVVDAAQADPDELAAQRLGDALAQRGLAGARRAGEAEDRPLHVLLELADGQVFEDPLLDLLEVVVVGVEDLAGPAEVEPVAARLAPGEDRQPVEVGPDDRVLGRARVHPGQPLELALGLVQDFVRAGSAVLIRSQSSATSGFSLSLSPSSSWIALICWRRKWSRWALVSSEPTCSWILVESSRTASCRERILPEPLQPGPDVDLAQQLLLLLDRERQARGQQVGQPARLAGVHRRDLQLLGNLLALVDHPLEEPVDVMHQGVELDPFLDDLLAAARPRRSGTARSAPRSTSRARYCPWQTIRVEPSGNLSILRTVPTQTVG